ncbi:tetraacyldisaccharide 4'-kinase [Flavobacterium sp. J49]|uniref:tetraacyldisaccharide 4'-kinase n=1 Tax=Flavobacterium sp. J49 TaxID=2718534 RepID=UPI0015947D54|nr:tetraacyldisaccharide 4'-kinase [Flavobacterium sp. J49]MBF6642243.1 tetraacyldisaccharide 4'-kinase [Flavobacterium sp. J49]NIC03489.1 tetraacyldisaccharide 4'-kinase [Flavobacterium sp. J49]
MILLRKLLFPLAILYGFITAVRNYLYDKGILKSYSFDIPIIAVGNLSVGGTGKTPQIEYLIRLLSPHYKVATLSRGYKRKSKGFILADANTNAAILGDEPFQYFHKFPQVQVAVDADRRNGITQLLAQKDKPEVILLDDAYQHRKVKAGFYILLTAYGDLFCDDYMLPTGNLRESRTGAKRAHMIIVTKCPSDITELAQENIKKKIGLNVPVFFSRVEYDGKVYNESANLEVTEVKSKEKLLLAGIAKPKPFFDFLQSGSDVVMTFPDHHHFSEGDISNIKSQANEKIIVTTEKDFVRLQAANLAAQLYYLPIKSELINHSNTFDQTILDYVGTSTRNR